jgi:hypothetical protein
MRQAFIQCETKGQALEECPWACEAIEVAGGYRCFESANDVKVWKSQA